MPRSEVVIVGGGPAGLAAAIHCRLAGASVVLRERVSGVPDKACGEGLLPTGAAALARMGVRGVGVPFVGIRYVQEGASVEARFRDGPGLGVRRTTLVSALRSRAEELGVELREGEVRRADLSATLVVAADGRDSRLRREAGLDGVARSRPRSGARRHFRVAPWTDHVEVHWGPGVEAYVTPVAADEVNVALLWSGSGNYDSLLARFPSIAARVSGAEAVSSRLGFGPLERRAARRATDGMVLLGDAAGFLDGITGEGLSIAFHMAEVLGGMLPRVLARGATRDSLRGYEAAYARAWRRYELTTRGLLEIGARPWLRRALLRGLARCPGAFEVLLNAAIPRVGGERIEPVPSELAWTGSS